MANNFQIPKQRELTENETITSYQKWQSNILFHLSQINQFAPYLEAEWSKHGVANRGLQDDRQTVEAADRKTGAQKKIVLELMLSYVAQHAHSITA